VKCVLILMAVVFFHVPPVTALAATQCDVPVAEWKPRETLKAKLEAQGWRVFSITLHGGCYQVDATNEKQVVVHTLFDPKTLARIEDVSSAG